MLAIIQRLCRRGRNAPAHSTPVCNYRDNYYGDQVCTVQAPDKP